MTKQEALEKLPTEAEARNLAKELYPSTTLFEGKDIIQAQREAFIDGLNLCRYRLAGKGVITAINFDSLLTYINLKTKRNFKIINDAVKRKYRSLLKQGYTIEDVQNAVNNAANSQYHKENGGQYLTPEFFSRPDTIDKYSTKAIIKNENNEQGTAQQAANAVKDFLNTPLR